VVREFIGTVGLTLTVTEFEKIKDGGHIFKNSSLYSFSTNLRPGKSLELTVLLFDSVMVVFDNYHNCDRSKYIQNDSYTSQLPKTSYEL